MQRLRNFALPVAALAALACRDAQSPGTGRLTILLKDAPGDLVAAVVTIAEVDLQGSGGTQVLSDTAVTTDLLTLASDAATLVQDAVVPAGTYAQLRFVITGGYIEVDNGDGTTSIYASSPSYPGLPTGATVTGQLQMPSFGQSGLKVTLPADALIVPEGGDKVLVVDFDVSQSFGRQAGGSGQWVMHPVIKGADITLTGGATVSLSLGAGVVLPGGAALDGFTATLTASDGSTTTTAFADPDNDGTFVARFAYLVPGDYTVTIAAPAGVSSFTTSPALPATVTVPSGGTGTLALTVTAAS